MFPLQIAGVILLVAIIAAIALTLRGRKDSKSRILRSRSRRAAAIACGWSRWRSVKRKAPAPLGGRNKKHGKQEALRRRGASWYRCTWYLGVGALLFAISVVGIFLNRKNLIVLLMAIELMLLAVNINFVAFSHYLGDYPDRSSCSSF